MKTNVVIDTSSFINLEKGKRLELLADLDDHVFHVTDTVGHEIQREKQFLALIKAMQAGYIRSTRLEDLEGLEVYVEQRRRIDPGESSCIALAHLNNWLVTMDDGNATAQAIAMTIGTQSALSSNDIVDLIRRRTRRDRRQGETALSPVGRPRGFRAVVGAQTRRRKISRGAGRSGG